MANKILTIHGGSYLLQISSTFRTCWHRLQLALAVFVMLSIICGDAVAAPFTPDQKTALVKELQEQTAASEGWARFNQQWDVGFKVAVLVLGVLAAIGGALAGTLFKQATPVWLTICNILVGAAITAITAFAFSTLNFPARAELYRKKAIALNAVRLQLLYSNPDADKLIPIISEIYSWHDSTAPDVQIPQGVLSPANANPGQSVT
jgi:hypothetical protein